MFDWVGSAYNRKIVYKLDIVGYYMEGQAEKSII